MAEKDVNLSVGIDRDRLHAARPGWSAKEFPGRASVGRHERTGAGTRREVVRVRRVAFEVVDVLRFGREVNDVVREALDGLEYEAVISDLEVDEVWSVNNTFRRGKDRAVRQDEYLFYFAALSEAVNPVAAVPEIEAVRGPDKDVIVGVRSVRSRVQVYDPTFGEIPVLSPPVAPCCGRRRIKR
jgi:hypothetical protein